MRNKYINQLLVEQREKYKVKIEQYAKNLEPNIEEALKTKNINRLRSIMKLDLNDKDLYFEQLMTKTLFLAEQDLPIFEPFEISKLNLDIKVDKSDWTEGYFLDQKSYLTVNFSLERMIHLIDVKQHLYPHQEGIKNDFRIGAKQKSKSIAEKIKIEFDKFKENPKAWFEQNPEKAIGILVATVILVWLIL